MRVRLCAHVLAACNARAVHKPPHRVCTPLQGSKYKAGMMAALRLDDVKGGAGPTKPGAEGDDLLDLLDAA